MLTDPIADMLTRIRNANMALHDQVEMPGSHLKTQIARVLEEQGYIVGYESGTDGIRSTLTVKLKYDQARRRVITGITRVSKPGRRVYADKDSLPKVLGGMGIAIISTSQGLVTGHEARRRGVGGEVLCTVW
ncbi:MAG: 30S ribosomal protein S8 [Thermoleophilia bacterium]|jgi:small subunit ribosomal protein S8|nr:30S ribosomal protein S8 [Thermoleophilia bacterium]MCX6409718.1 30S ribosomal protein S8 [Actinomycetota bacterium]NBS60294.1 30S ribosomal protein S8 [Betaproteobacteria bacterium]